MSVFATRRPLNLTAALAIAAAVAAAPLSAARATGWIGFGGGGIGEVYYSPTPYGGVAGRAGYHAYYSYPDRFVIGGSLAGYYFHPAR